MRVQDADRKSSSIQVNRLLSIHTNISILSILMTANAWQKLLLLTVHAGMFLVWQSNKQKFQSEARRESFNNQCLPETFISQRARWRVSCSGKVNKQKVQSELRGESFDDQCLAETFISQRACWHVSCSGKVNKQKVQSEPRRESLRMSAMSMRVVLCSS